MKKHKQIVAQLRADVWRPLCCSLDPEIAGEFLRYLLAKVRHPLEDPICGELWDNAENMIEDENSYEET